MADVEVIGGLLTPERLEQEALRLEALAASYERIVEECREAAAKLRARAAELRVAEGGSRG